MNIAGFVPDVTKAFAVCAVYYMWTADGGNAAWYVKQSYDSSTGNVTATLTWADDPIIDVHILYLA